MLLDLSKLDFLVNTNSKTKPNTNNKQSQPLFKFFLSTPREKGMTIDDLEKHIATMPDYVAGRNFDFKYKGEKPDFNSFNLFNHKVDQKKHGKATSPTVPKIGTTDKLFVKSSTRTTTKKTTSEEDRGQKLQKHKSNYSSSSTHPFCQEITTVPSESLSKERKLSNQTDKKSSSRLNNKPLNLANATLSRLVKAIKTSSSVPETLKLIYPYLNSKCKECHVFHDYFNDLLVWHNDTLNKNFVNIWNPVTGLHKDFRKITNKMESLTSEVDTINEYLNSFEVLPSGALRFCIFCDY